MYKGSECERNVIMFLTGTKLEWKQNEIFPSSDPSNLLWLLSKMTEFYINVLQYLSWMTPVSKEYSSHKTFGNSTSRFYVLLSGESLTSQTVQLFAPTLQNLSFHTNHFWYSHTLKRIPVPKSTPNIANCFLASKSYNVTSYSLLSSSSLLLPWMSLLSWIHPAPSDTCRSITSYYSLTSGFSHLFIYFPPNPNHPPNFHFIPPGDCYYC